MRNKRELLWAWLAFTSLPALANDFPRLDEALPEAEVIGDLAPVFDFDGDSCLPSAGVSRSGTQNGGLKPSGSLTGGCRNTQFLSLSNTLHRYACVEQAGSRYCGHFFALYFLKDQILDGINSGHRHDWEHVAVWTRDGVVTHGSYSAHGDLYQAEADSLEQEAGHLKFVYHKDGLLTHAMRFAKQDEQAENPAGQFVTPTLISWYRMQGDGVDNQTLRDKFNSFDFGSANVPLKDRNFLTNLNAARPSGYPAFTQASLDSSR